MSLDVLCRHLYHPGHHLLVATIPLDLLSSIVRRRISTENSNRVTMVDSTPLIPADTSDGKKQGHTIFLCCCDSKKAVEIFNVLGVISVIIMMVLLSVNKYADVEVEIEGNVYGEKEQQELRDNYKYYMIAYGIGLAVYLITIMGACMYNAWFVWVAILYTLFNLGNMIYFGATQAQDEEGWIFGYIVYPIVWSLLYIYPHAVFIKEVNNDIMTPKTYARERASLCCI